MYRKTGLLLFLKMLAVILLLGLPAWSGSESLAAVLIDDFANDAPAKNVHTVLDRENGEVVVYLRGEHFTTYQFHESFRIPFLWPVFAGSGIDVTRNWPMGADDPEITDHPHHQSLWTAFGDFNGYDHWHNEPIITVEVDAVSGESRGAVRARNLWVDDRRNPLVDEIREYIFYDTPDTVRYFDQSVTFRASYGDVTFGDDKEGLFAFRIRTEIQGNKNGMLTNAYGESGERAVYGTPAPWMDYSGPVEGEDIHGIALFSHPDNFRLPAWHVRDYGLVACNFFAMKDVAGMEDEGTYVLQEGEELTLSVRYLIYSGEMDLSELQEQFDLYARGDGSR